MTRAEKILLFGSLYGLYGGFNPTELKTNLLYRNLGRGYRQMIEGFDGTNATVVTYFGNKAVRREYVNYNMLPDNIIDEILYLFQMWESMNTGRGRWDGNRWRYGRWQNNTWYDGRWYDGRWHGGGWRGGHWYDDDGDHGHDNGHGGGHGGGNDDHGHGGGQGGGGGQGHGGHGPGHPGQGHGHDDEGTPRHGGYSET
jgi:hypothetical protein